MRKWLHWLGALLIFVLLASVIVIMEESGKQEYPIVFLGDSIIGNVRDETSVTALLETKTGMRVYNGAFGGTTAALQNVENRAAYNFDCISLTELSKAAAADDFSVQKAGIAACAKMGYYIDALHGLANVDLDKMDILFIEHGVNDYLTGISVDNPQNQMDVYTFGGALRTSLQLLQDRYPNLKIILCTPVFCWFPDDESDCTEKDFGGGVLEDYVNLELDIAAAYGVSVIDNYHDSGIGGENAEPGEWTVYTEDGVHLNQAGRKIIADRIAAYLEGREK